VELRIGIAETPQPVTVTMADDTDRQVIKESVDSVLAGDSPVLWLTDTKGREVAVAGSRLTFVEIGPSSANPIGFG